MPLKGWDLQNLATLRADRQEGRIGGGPFGAERGQDGGDHLVVQREDAQQRRVEPAFAIILRGRGEFVVKAEPVEEALQLGVVMRAETVMRAERIGHPGERPADEALQHLAVGHVVGHLAQPVHVIGEGQQARGQAGQRGEGVPHPGGARHLAERADMRQAGGAVAGLEQCGRFARGGEAGGDLLRLLERPGLRERCGCVAECI